MTSLPNNRKLDVLSVICFLQANIQIEMINSLPNEDKIFIAFNPSSIRFSLFYPLLPLLPSPRILPFMEHMYIDLISQAKQLCNILFANDNILFILLGFYYSFYVIGL